MRLKTNVFKWSMRARLKILGGLLCVIGILTFISSDIGHATLDWSKSMIDVVGDKANLRVNQVNFSRLQYTTEADIKEALQVSKGDPILQVDLDAIRQRIEQLPWVRSCVVERYLPDEIYILIQLRYGLLHHRFQGQTHGNLQVHRLEAPADTYPRKSLFHGKSENQKNRIPYDEKDMKHHRLRFLRRNKNGQYNRVQLQKCSKKKMVLKDEMSFCSY